MVSCSRIPTASKRRSLRALWPPRRKENNVRTCRQATGTIEPGWARSGGAKVCVSSSRTPQELLPEYQRELPSYRRYTHPIGIPSVGWKLPWAYVGRTNLERGTRPGPTRNDGTLWEMGVEQVVIKGAGNIFEVCRSSVYLLKYVPARTVDQNCSPPGSSSGTPAGLPTELTARPELPAWLSRKDRVEMT